MQVLLELFLTKLKMNCGTTDMFVLSFCGQKILSIDDAEVDHIRPFSQGGETTLENAQLLHRHCNRVKNDNDFESVNVNEIELDNSIDDSDEREE